MEGEADGLNKAVDELGDMEASVVEDTNTGILVVPLLVTGLVLVTGKAESVDTIASEATVGVLEVPPEEVDDVDVIGTADAVEEDTNGSEALVVPTSEIGILVVLLEVCLEDVDIEVVT